MFNCKVCVEKDKRIADLKQVIADQKRILNPPQRINRYEMQEDMIMNGANQEEVDPAALVAQQIEEDNIRRESDLIFTGNDIETEEVG